MNYKRGSKIPHTAKSSVVEVNPIGKKNSLYDLMQDGREFSLLNTFNGSADLKVDLERCIADIEEARGRKLICYVANVIKPSRNSVGIDPSDDLPFTELCQTIPEDTKELDVLIVTPGGSAQQIAKFVDTLRFRFNHVAFLLPNIAMSAGTIFVMSGDEIIMSPSAYIGPIDPQVQNKNGMLVPAQSLLKLIKDIQIRGEENIKNKKGPDWTDMQILQNIDPKEIGNSLTASEYSIKLVKEYLIKYKFRTWINRSNGDPVTEEHKITTANKIAEKLCNHDHWKSHGAGITRESAWEECDIKIRKSEDIENLDRALRRFWALSTWIFERTPVYKIFMSSNYSLLKASSLVTPQQNNGS